jgi:hypothetical protein
MINKDFTFLKLFLPLVLLSPALFFVSCAGGKDEFNAPNDFPIEFNGEKVLAYNKPFVPPSGIARSQDTFLLYSIANKSQDTVWIEAVPVTDTTMAYVNDPTVKIISIKKIYFHPVNQRDWLMSTEGNGSPNGANENVKLGPGEKTYFHNGTKRSKPAYDSIYYDIVVKIKKTGALRDSIVTKKLVLRDNHYEEDIRPWGSNGLK